MLYNFCASPAQKMARQLRVRQEMSCSCGKADLAKVLYNTHKNYDFHKCNKLGRTVGRGEQTAEACSQTRETGARHRLSPDRIFHGS